MINILKPYRSVHDNRHLQAVRGRLSVFRIPLAWILLIGLWLVWDSVKAQDPHFSQYSQAPLWLNPAMTALKNDPQLNLNYRSQWASIAQPFVTPQLALIYPYVKDKNHRIAGAGLNIISDKAGEGGLLSTTGLSGALGWNLVLTEAHVIALGFSAGFLQKNLNLQQLTTENQWVGGSFNAGAGLGEQFQDNKVSNLDLSSGLIWYMENEDGLIQASGGLSVHHFNKQEEIFLSEAAGLPLRVAVHGQFLAVDHEKVDISPTALIMYQANAQMVHLGAVFKYKLPRFNTVMLEKASVNLGTSYRLNDALILGLQYENPYFLLGLSYDINVSPLRGTSNGRGATELSLVLRRPLSNPGAGATFRKRSRQKKEEILEEPESQAHQILLSGIITDIDNFEPVQAKINVYDADGNLVTTAHSSAQSGAYQISLASDNYYRITVTADFFMDEKDELDVPFIEVEEFEIYRHFKLRKMLPGGSLIIEDIKFESAKSVLLPESNAALDELARQLRNNPSVTLEIAGHTDSEGSEATNLTLSKERARAVANYLMLKGISPSRLSVKGYGEAQPIDTNKTEEGRARNRRVEFRFKK